MPSAESPGPSHAHTSDRELLGSEIGPLVAALGLDGVEEGYLTGPLVGQVLRMERRSARAQSRYSALRLTAILGGVAIPVLVTWPGPMATAAAARGMAAILGVTVAAASAVEGLFRFGERWRHYRRTVEALKAEFWLPAQLAGPYRGSSDRRHAFPAFVERVEHLPREDVEAYFVAVRPRDDTGAESSSRPAPGGADRPPAGEPYMPESASRRSGP